WFFRVQPFGTAGLDGAEAARAGADVAQDHEGGGAPLPAVADVRTAGALANGVQALVGDQLAQGVIVRADRRAHLQPGRARDAGRDDAEAARGCALGGGHGTAKNRKFDRFRRHCSYHNTPAGGISSSSSMATSGGWERIVQMAPATRSGFSIRLTS